MPTTQPRRRAEIARTLVVVPALNDGDNVDAAQRTTRGSGRIQATNAL